MPDYPGRKLSPGQQRLRVMAAGAGQPGIGPVRQAKLSAKYAPPVPHQRRAAAARIAAVPAVGIAGSIAGARYGGRLINRSAGLTEAARSGIDHTYRAFNRVIDHGPKRLARLRRGDASTLPPRRVGQIAGAYVGGHVAGGVALQTAISRNLAAQRRYNADHRHFAKALRVSGVRTARPAAPWPPKPEIRSWVTSRDRYLGPGTRLSRRPALTHERRKMLGAGLGAGITGVAHRPPDPDDLAEALALAHKKFPGRTTTKDEVHSAALRDLHRRPREAGGFARYSKSATVRRVHHAEVAGRALCGGSGRRWNSATVTTSRGWHNVTCLRCLRHPASPHVTGKAAVVRVVKFDGDPDTQTFRRNLARRRRLSAKLNTVGGVAGLSSLALLGAKRPGLIGAREKLLLGSAGVGGFNALNSASIARREAKLDQAPQPVAKSSPPITTSMHDDEAKRLVHGKGGYGLTGPLPGHLDRPARMKAYEARYVAAGGKKSQRWQRVAQGAEAVRNVGVAGATAAGAGWLAASSPRVRKLVSPIAAARRFEKLNPQTVKHKAERLAVAAGTLGGAAELSEEGAKRRRAAYSSAPGGVAASALRRMQAYTPGG